ncbi:MAG: 16S rRNA (cytosine(1402)-N(4))-methyltransferase RsmH [Candidatus Paceibacterota bacterium]|jgi:16S rRNA (cytosine1402-N4)-methyltransferase
MPHIPVLLKEAIEALDLKKGDVVLDCTINGGGHSLVITEMIGKRGILIGLDEDKSALARAKEHLAGSEAKVILEESNFRNLDKALMKSGIKEVDKILFDFGLSSDQLDNSGRGFSFKRDEPLLMTLGVVPKIGQLTALEIVNSWNEEDLAGIIYEYGEERFSRRIAHGIAEARKKDVIRTTTELREIVERSVPASYRNGRIHPATRTFQGLRIAVNDELGAIKEGLVKASQALSKGGRIAAISFHSLEDRIVKQYFRDLAKSGEFLSITKKPIVPGKEEENANPRARSAKLRSIKKIQ